jgi:penicillin-binding protein 1B
VEVLRIDRMTDLIADDSCPNDSFSAAFLIGAAPQGTCSHMGEDSQSLGSRLFGLFTGKSAAPVEPPPDSPQTDATKHRNLLQKIFGTGKDKPKDQQPQ